MEPYINTTVKDESLTEAPQLRGLVAVVISPTPQSYEFFSYIPNKKQEKFHHGRKKHSISRRKGKKRHPPGGQRSAPRKVGITAVNHFRQNFRDAGFRDGGIRPWQRTRRQDSKSPDAKYTPLTSRRDHLMRSIEFQTEPGQVLISGPVPYAEKETP